MPRPAGAREPADRGREAMAESTERDQVVGRRGVRRRVLEGPVVRLDGGLLAARDIWHSAAVRSCAKMRSPRSLEYFGKMLPVRLSSWSVASWSVAYWMP